MVGAAIGAAGMLALVYAGVTAEVSELLFAFAHPGHVLLSAVASAGMYQRYAKGSWPTTMLVGVAVALGVGTLSDSLIPLAAEAIFAAGDEHVHAHGHFGIIDLWWLVVPLAIVGAMIGRAKPSTELPHAGHVLLSAAASMFHMSMAMSAGVSPWTMAGMSVFLFVAVWVPCCTSDIILPLLLVPKARWQPCHHCKEADA